MQAQKVSSFALCSSTSPRRLVVTRIATRSPINDWSVWLLLLATILTSSFKYITRYYVEE